MARGFDDMFNRLQGAETDKKDVSNKSNNKSDVNKKQVSNKDKTSKSLTSKQDTQNIPTVDVKEKSLLNSNTEHTTEASIKVNAENKDITKQEIVPKDVTEPIIKEDTGHFLRTMVDTSTLLQQRDKLTVEETHTRTTVLIRNELLYRLNALAKRKKRGFKTIVFNTALEVILDDLEQQLKNLEK